MGIRENSSDLILHIKYVYALIYCSVCQVIAAAFVSIREILLEFPPSSLFDLPLPFKGRIRMEIYSILVLIELPPSLIPSPHIFLQDNSPLFGPGQSEEFRSNGGGIMTKKWNIGEMLALYVLQC